MYISLFILIFSSIPDAYGGLEDRGWNDYNSKIAGMRNKPAVDAAYSLACIVNEEIKTATMCCGRCGIASGKPQNQTRGKAIPARYLTANSAFLQGNYTLAHRSAGLDLAVGICHFFKREGLRYVRL